MKILETNCRFCSVSVCCLARLLPGAALIHAGCSVEGSDCCNSKLPMGSKEQKQCSKERAELEHHFSAMCFSPSSCPASIPLCRTARKAELCWISAAAPLSMFVSIEGGKLWERRSQRCRERRGLGVLGLFRGGGLKLCQERFGLGVRKHFFSKTVVMQLHGLPSGGVTITRGAQNHGDVALRSVGWVGAGLGHL